MMLSFPKASKNIKDSINNAADQIGTLFATMHLKTLGMIITDAAEQVGKCFILFLNIFVHFYTSALLSISHTICK